MLIPTLRKGIPLILAAILAGCGSTSSAHPLVSEPTSSIIAQTAASVASALPSTPSTQSPTAAPSATPDFAALHKGDLSHLHIDLPKGWALADSDPLQYSFIDPKQNPVGSIAPRDSGSYKFNETDKPNHSSVTADETFDIPAGKCQFITLDMDNGTAASGITGTHDIYYGIITVPGKAVYVLELTRNDKESETKDLVIGILKSITYKD
ncbi:hypothetical protein [Gorillibacterium massiliense]|uniref:hypothetical protein n=1 Tax=Gorillibacterium massiliense TaxID=1280390 RepID=UPI0004B71932|nr:hypothetical protein [Gorillibacterium massiliense]